MTTSSTLDDPISIEVNFINTTNDSVPQESPNSISPNDNGLVSHHQDSFDWDVVQQARKERSDPRELLDQPMAGVAIIAVFFLTIILLLIIVVFIFYKKRNTIFVLEKSVHGGLYSPGDRSVVIGHTTRARHMTANTTTMDSSPNDTMDWDSDVSSEDESERNWHGQLATDRGCSNPTASYFVHTNGSAFVNPYYSQQPRGVMEHALNCPVGLQERSKRKSKLHAFSLAQSAAILTNPITMATKDSGSHTTTITTTTTTATTMTTNTSPQTVSSRSTLCNTEPRSECRVDDLLGLEKFHSTAIPDAERWVASVKNEQSPCIWDMYRHGKGFNLCISKKHIRFRYPSVRYV